LPTLIGQRSIRKEGPNIVAASLPSSARGFRMTIVFLLAVMYVPVALVIAMSAGAVGYMLSQQQNRALIESFQLDQDEALSSLAELRGVATQLTVQVAEHSDRVLDIEQSLTETTSPDQPENQITRDAGAELRKANEKLQADLAQAKRQLDEQSKRLKREQHAARIDKVTMLLNREAFDETLKGFVSDARISTEGGMVLIEIDHFKELNDRHGRTFGDKVLQQVAAIIRENLVGLDIACARYGGGQFGIIFFRDSREVIKKVLGEIRQAMEKGLSDGEVGQIATTFSCGLAMRRTGTIENPLPATVEKALSAAKAAGHNCSYYYEGGRCSPLLATVATAVPQGQIQGAPSAPGAEKSPPEKQETPAAPAAAAPVAAPAARAPAAAPPAAVPTSTLSTAPAPAVAVLDRERRGHKRKVCNAVYQVAPYVPDAPASGLAFASVRLSDVSAGGCALVLTSRPAARAYVVAVNKPDGAIYLVAEVVRVSEQGRDELGQPKFVVGCRFTGRISMPTPQLEAQTV
jgi:diguanylate cyclase (GGDEF)-like protein